MAPGLRKASGWKLNMYLMYSSVVQYHSATLYLPPLHKESLYPLDTVGCGDIWGQNWELPNSNPSWNTEMLWLWAVHTALSMHLENGDTTCLHHRAVWVINCIWAVLWIHSCYIWAKIYSCKQKICLTVTLGPGLQGFTNEFLAPGTIVFP